MSSLTSIYVTWDQLIFNDLNVIGYVLYMDSGNDGGFEIIMNGRNMPGVNYHLVEGTVTGQSYSFKVSALNFNGSGEMSDIALVWSCLPPRELRPPKFVSSTATTLTVDWTMPLILNGCPLL